ncbi:MAG: valine--tRNA ligase [Lachnospiraceae bacterium]|nr:valine--tRNA ligase [Lachnospiraceae bacterium]
MEELAKTYDPKGIEDRLYQKWEDKGYFHAQIDPDKTPFTIVMPPPNITGQLHMGHALDNTLQDILIRYKRMQGYSALWQPGTDHAAIATEVKVTEDLKEKGIDKDDLTREEFLKYAWDWKEEYGGRIVNQLKKLGASADWERERFTMDEGCSNAVNEVFVRLFDKGYIYKGSRIINWCPVCPTTISDAAVALVEQTGHLWHIKYPIVGEEGKYVEIATTRPETMLGDTAVAVNPDDERYKNLVGKKVLLPIMDREIPIIADSYVDKEFGTGCVKITPAHDPNDFEVGKRHDLEEINILNDDATINANGGPYEGMDRYEARDAIVKKLDEMGLLVRVEEHVHSVGTHDRCKTTVEPMIKPQWFVKMEEMAKPAIEALDSGRLKFVPENYGKTYRHWLEDIRDWCISRQLWWGHRIPAYYCQDCGSMTVAREAPEKCPRCGSTNLTQDEDTLDTWFSSALWPFSTLGWPEDTPEMNYFYPTDVLVTGYDIIFFWVVRMVFSGLEQTGTEPFHTVLIHGLVRDPQGRKMSKSLGNGIDPLEVIDKYGADALRLTLVTGNAPGNDMRFSWERVEASRNFANKIWNATRFLLLYEDSWKADKPEVEDMATEDKWILSLLNTLARDVTENMEKFELGIAVQKVFDFIWEEFCDWYIEIVKPRLAHKDENVESADSAFWTLTTVLSTAMKLLHPFMPFISEEIYCTLHPEEETIMTAPWPNYKDGTCFLDEEIAIEGIKELVRGVRNIRSGHNVPPSRKCSYYVVSHNAVVCDIYRRHKDIYGHLIGAEDIYVESEEEDIPEGAVSVVIPNAVVYIPLEELVDLEAERERLTKERDRLEKELARSNDMLQNENFLSRAPEEKVTAEPLKLEKYKAMREHVDARLAELG